MNHAASVSEFAMRHVGYAVLALLAFGCGPDPNARLSGDLPESSGGIQSGSGGAGTGGVETGGTTVSPAGGSGGSGGTTPLPSGGAAGSTRSDGGASGATSSGGVTGVPTGGTTVTGGTGGGPGGKTSLGSGGVGSGGTTSRPGSGGSTTPTSGALTNYSFPEATEPCTPTKDFSGGQTLNFGTTGAFCFRTADDFSDYGCSNTDGRTLKINGKVVDSCGGKPPAKLGSFYYFDFGAGKYEYASVNWYCSSSACLGPHPVPSCGHYPAWQSGQTVAPCVDAPATTDVDAGVAATDIDSGS